VAAGLLARGLLGYDGRSMPKSLVTGGAGFIGAHLSRQLLAMGHQVVALDDLSGGFESNLPAGAEFVRGSVVDHQLLAGLFQRHRFDYVYHLAAYAAEGLSHFIRRFNYQNNVVGSVNVLNEAIHHEVKHFVFTSSIAVYGAGQPPLREDQVARPEDPYGVAKLAVEQDLHAAHEMFGIGYTIFRPHNVYGEYQNIGDRYRNVIGIFMNQIMSERPLSVFGDGLQTRAFSYVGDILGPLARCVEVPGAHNQIFNVGGETPYSVKQLAEAVLAVAGSKSPLRHLPARKEVVHAFADHSKVRRVFGPQPATDLTDGLSRMWAWARAQGPRKSPYFSAIEVDRNLPSFWRED
jgi:UDP-glucose 4-epimerase